jgi:oligopeptide/dipeptide ABC transporter ATP-binding protein
VLVEVAATDELFRHPRHPYTRALLAALPTREHRRGALSVIPGEVPDLQHPPAGCRFAPRCPLRLPTCEVRPDLRSVGPGVSVACWLHEPSEARPATATAAGGNHGDG